MVAGGLSLLLAEARASVRAVPPEEARGVVVDVREPEEWLDGVIPGSKLVPRGLLEMRVTELLAPGESLCVVCATGTRSLLAAHTLQRMGFRAVSLEGGLSAWRAAGLPLERSSALSSKERARFARHLTLAEIGAVGQEALGRARVLLIGVGGLGSPAALYLAAAGVGTIGLADPDVVELSNLQRQILHSEAELGKRKVESGRRSIEQLNRNVDVLTYPFRLEGERMRSVLEQDWDIVIDGTDHIPTRYALNALCLELKLPWVYGALHRFEGQIALFEPGGPCYRCLYPVGPNPEATPSCAEAGVVGAFVGVIGAFQALQAILYIAKKEAPLSGKLLSIAAMANEFDVFTIPIDPTCDHSSLKSPSGRSSSSKSPSGRSDCGVSVKDDRSS